VIKLLLEHGADIQAYDQIKRVSSSALQMSRERQGPPVRTPLGEARKRNQQELVEFLVSQGVKDDPLEGKMPSKKTSS
jgi:hypothetical protein